MMGFNRILRRQKYFAIVTMGYLALRRHFGVISSHFHGGGYLYLASIADARPAITAGRDDLTNHDDHRCWRLASRAI